MKITYGHTVRSNDELYVRLAEEAGMETVTGGSPGSVLVDFFPARMFADISGNRERLLTTLFM